MTTIELWTVVPTADGDLRALVHVPTNAPGPLPGVVLVDGSGEGACDDWGEWPGRFAEQGTVVLTHDKPGCGGSPGDWLSQSFADRAHESLAALRVLQDNEAVSGRPVGLVGFSQGGWVSLLAATLDANLVDFVISLSGPGVSPAEQERDRIDRALRARGATDDGLAEALSWIDERAGRLLAGEDIGEGSGRSSSPFRQGLVRGGDEYFDNPMALGFLARNLDFDPVPVLQEVTCPVLALFGTDDTLVPIADSVIACATHLRASPGSGHGIGVFCTTTTASSRLIPIRTFRGPISSHRGSCRWSPALSRG